MSRMATQVSRMATNATGGTAEQGGYSLAGSQPKGSSQGGPNRDTYVAEGYRDLNPQYEKKQNQPTFSLGSNLPRTVRGWQGKKMNEQRNSSGTAPGVQPGEKGEGEAAPQLQDTDERKKHRGGSKQDPEPSQDEKHQNHGSTQSNRSGGMMMQEASAEAGDGENTGVLGDQAVYSPGNDSDDSTVVPEDEEVLDENAPFNSWALVRARFQDAFGEWLGTTIFVLIGVSSNLAVVTGESQHPGIYQNMYWGWGLAVMLGIYISGGSSGAHLNPAVSIPLWVYRGFPARKLPVFIIFQILGAFTGGLIAIAIYRDAIIYNEGGLIAASSGVSIYTQPKDWVSPATAFFTEFTGTAILICSILALGDDSNSPPGAGMHAFIIGLLVVALVMSLGSNTGGCFNPVRDFGPRLAAMAMGYGSEVFTAYHNWWIWGAWGATISGGLTGGVLYDTCIFKGGESPVNYTPKKWAGKTNEGKLGVLQLFRQQTRAKNLETAMEKGEVENGGS
ncbi:aquaporin-like protein [Aureobasidium subglaciale]|nr:aquaporin-like protein [Aureobasidium subglaciale]KAI5222865.1 aquaporin-like protein [Aureobasidium subglaciale]KAI5226637.1 aquaporin-like protein [Aureobasidium subglaciale]KAI5263124.1 aquaporin-like protein [Aureobasidium subglaciale]